MTPTPKIWQHKSLEIGLKKFGKTSLGTDLGWVAPPDLRSHRQSKFLFGFLQKFFQNFLDLFLIFLKGFLILGGLHRQTRLHTDNALTKEPPSVPSLHHILLLSPPKQQSLRRKTTRLKYRQYHPFLPSTYTPRVS